MKFLILLFTYSLSFAGVGDSAGGSGNSITARQIQNLLEQDKYEVEVPLYKFDNNQWFRIHKICDEGANVRSINKVPIYMSEWDNRGDEMIKVQVGEDYARRDYEKEHNINIKLETPILIRKKKKIFGKNEDPFFAKKGKILSKKVFYLPSCEEIE